MGKQKVVAEPRSRKHKKETLEDSSNESEQGRVFYCGCGAHVQFQQFPIERRRSPSGFCRSRTRSRSRQRKVKSKTKRAKTKKSGTPRDTDEKQQKSQEIRSSCENEDCSDDKCTSCSSESLYETSIEEKISSVCSTVENENPMNQGCRASFASELEGDRRMQWNMDELSTGCNTLSTSAAAALTPSTIPADYVVSTIEAAASEVSYACLCADAGDEPMESASRATVIVEEDLESDNEAGDVADDAFEEALESAVETCDIVECAMKDITEAATEAGNVADDHVEEVSPTDADNVADDHVEEVSPTDVDNVADDHVEEVSPTDVDNVADVVDGVRQSTTDVGVVSDEASDEVLQSVTDADDIEDNSDDKLTDAVFIEAPIVDDILNKAIDTAVSAAKENPKTQTKQPPEVSNSNSDHTSQSREVSTVVARGHAYAYSFTAKAADAAVLNAPSTVCEDCIAAAFKSATSQQRVKSGNGKRPEAPTTLASAISKAPSTVVNVASTIASTLSLAVAKAIFATSSVAARVAGIGEDEAANTGSRASPSVDKDTARGKSGTSVHAVVADDSQSAVSAAIAAAAVDAAVAAVEVNVPGADDNDSDYGSHDSEDSDYATGDERLLDATANNQVQNVSPDHLEESGQPPLASAATAVSEEKSSTLSKDRVFPFVTHSSFAVYTASVQSLRSKTSMKKSSEKVNQGGPSSQKKPTKSIMRNSRKSKSNISKTGQSAAIDSEHKTSGSDLKTSRQSVLEGAGSKSQESNLKKGISSKSHGKSNGNDESPESSRNLSKNRDGNGSSTSSDEDKKGKKSSKKSKREESKKQDSKASKSSRTKDDEKAKKKRESSGGDDDDRKNEKKTRSESRKKEEVKKSRRDSAKKSKGKSGRPIEKTKGKEQDSTRSRRGSNKSKRDAEGEDRDSRGKRKGSRRSRGDSEGKDQDSGRTSRKKGGSKSRRETDDKDRDSGRRSCGGSRKLKRDPFDSFDSSDSSDDTKRGKLKCRGTFKTPEEAEACTLRCIAREGKNRMADTEGRDDGDFTQQLCPKCYAKYYDPAGYDLVPPGFCQGFKYSAMGGSTVQQTARNSSCSRPKSCVPRLCNERMTGDSKRCISRPSSRDRSSSRPVSAGASTQCPGIPPEWIAGSWPAPCSSFGGSGTQDLCNCGEVAGPKSDLLQTFLQGVSIVVRPTLYDATLDAMTALSDLYDSTVGSRPPECPCAGALVPTRRVCAPDCMESSSSSSSSSGSSSPSSSKSNSSTSSSSSSSSSSRRSSPKPEPKTEPKTKPKKKHFGKEEDVVSPRPRSTVRGSYKSESFSNCPKTSSSIITIKKELT